MQRRRETTESGHHGSICDSTNQWKGLFTALPVWAVETRLGRYSLNRVSRTLRSFALRVKKINQVLDLILLKHLSKGGHSSPTIMNLMFDLRLAQTLANHAQAGSALSSLTIHSMAVLTPLLVKERGSRFTPLRSRMNCRCRPFRQTAKQSGGKERATNNDQNSRGSPEASSPKTRYLPAKTRRKWNSHSEARLLEAICFN
jgi:hypothetical protein